MEKGLVSVIIPTYKSANIISRAVESVLNQTYKHIEILVIDDNSPDWPERAETEIVMQNYTGYSNIRYIKHSENKNGAAARNTGIQHSKGEYIAFLDDDDWFMPVKIEKQIDFLNEHPEFNGVYCFAERGGKPIPTIPYKGDVTKQLLLMQSRLFTPTLLLRAYSIKAINGFDVTFKRHQDYEMLLRYFKSGSMIGCVEDVLVGIGIDGVSNHLNADKLYKLKVNFINKFIHYIEEINKSEPDFKRIVLAKHFGQTLIPYIKDGNLFMVLKVILRYSWMCPSIFFEDISCRIIMFWYRRIRKKDDEYINTIQNKYFG